MTAQGNPQSEGHLIRAGLQAVIAELGQYGLSNPDLTQLLDRAVRLTAQAFEVEYCKILELLPDGRAFVLRAGVGWEDGYVGQAIVEAGLNSQAGYTLLTSAPVIVEDLRTEERFSGPALLLDHGVISGISVVIPGENGPWGVLGAHTKQRRSFSTGDAQFFRSIANVLGAALVRKKMEESVRQREEDYRHFFDNYPIPMWVLDPKTTQFLAVNEAAIRHYGYSREEFLTLRAAEIRPSEQVAQFLESLESLPAEGWQHRGPWQLRKKDGTLIHVEVSHGRTTWEKREAVFALVMDVTERVLAEQATQLTEQRFQLVARATNDAVWDWDLRKDHLWCSEGICALFGYLREEVGWDSRWWKDRVHPSDRDRVWAGIHKVIEEGGVSWLDEYRFRRANGTYAYVFDRGYVLRDEQNQPIRMIGAMMDITERKQAEEALRASEETYRLLFENSPIPMWISDPNTMANLAVNQAALELYGYSRKEFMRMTRLDIRPPEEVRRFVKFCGERDALPFTSGIWKHRKKDGKAIELEICGIPTFWKGKPARIVMGKDVTAEERAREQLLNIAKGVSAATGEEFFRLLVEHLGKSLEAHCVLIGELLPGRANRCRTITMYSNGQIVANMEYDLTDTPCAETVRRNRCTYPERVQEAFPNDPWLAEHGINGYSGHLLLDSSGRAFGVLSALFRNPLENVFLVESMLQIFAVRAAAELERRRAEEQLRTSEANYRSLVEGAPYGIFRSTQDGRLLMANQALVEMLGYRSKAELLKANLDKDIYQDPAVRSQLVGRNGSKKPFQPVRGVEVGWRRKDGTPITVRLSGRPVFDDSGSLLYFESSVENVSEQKALEEHLRHVQKIEAIGQLAGGIAHDFNNLLTAILGSTELLGKHLRPRERSRQYLSHIAQAVDQAARLTNQLLVFSSRQVFQPNILDLCEVVTDSERILRRLISEDIELVVKVSARPVPVHADRGQLEQVLLNLAINGRDAMPEGGTLTIEASAVRLQEQTPRPLAVPPGRYALLSVTDTGMGMDPQTQARIFEPFFTTKEVGKGSGLGLATVYGIVQQSEGYISVASEPGRGTTFSIYLKLQEEKVAEQESTQRRAPRGSETILLVEDAKNVRRFARQVLDDAGYRVLEAGTPAQALEIFRSYKNPIHLLLTDVVMPGMNGGDLAKRLLAAEPNMKILYISGYADDAIRSNGILSDESSFLRKPFTSRDLAQRVGEVLGHRTQVPNQLAARNSDGKRGALIRKRSVRSKPRNS